MSEPFLISKAFDFSPAAVGKSFSSTLKGLLAIGCIIGIGWSVYLAFIKPHYSPIKTNAQTQQAKEIVNNTYNYPVKEDKLFIGINIKGWKIGILR